ncbi:chromosome segregation protein SMC [Sinomonas gamaensis]|uniref:chromosome segregation protein SMC n=1 Tax=Sinomonas gamaensis TaxID=2565624 RepID=UPI001486D82C|nr:chromosome segregation protein SMC [Sinomonas gamaensis]
MHLKTLTIRGFKSFASATTFEFEPGVTAVVGPNGSGKSNVVDALAWVMGEQGAKTLRGGKMEDVIFAGTAGRPPLGRAQVSLTIDNADGALPIEYSEVTISRTLFRTGGSEYAINGEACRLLDIQELLSDSGLGREMHVIVGQGQLDRVLHATPEDRRGFIEEAAGILKHRRRKERTVRKLDAMQGNLQRLADLTGEIRRQLGPLGRQAQVARRAQTIQADVRDARARLLADDVVRLRESLEKDRADQSALMERRAQVERDLEAARREQADAERAAAVATPRLNAARDLWYRLSSGRERLRSLAKVAEERRRLLGTNEPEHSGRDPERLERQAEEAREELAVLAEAIDVRAETLEEASEARAEAEAEAAEEDRRHTARLRALADRREGLARLAGAVAAARSRVEAAEGEIGRLRSSLGSASQRRRDAELEFTALESQVAGVEEGEEGLDAEYEDAAARQEAAEAALAEIEERRRDADAARRSLEARLEVLRAGLRGRDGSGAIAASGDGVLGPVASLVKAEPGFEAALAAALGAAAEGLAMDGADAAHRALLRLREDDGGQAALLVGGAPMLERPESPRPALPENAHWLTTVVTSDARVRSAIVRLLDHVVAVTDTSEAAAILAEQPDLMVVTRQGDVLTSAVVRGGSAGAPSTLELQAQAEVAEAELAAAQAEYERTGFELMGARDRVREAAERADAALAALHDSDAKFAAVAERLAALGAQLRGATAEDERLRASLAAAESQLESEQETLATAVERLEAAEEAAAGVEEDDGATSSGDRDRLAQRATAARAAELEARLALRSAEEQHRALEARAESLERAAAGERRAAAEAQRRAQERAAKAARAADVARAAQAGVEAMDRAVEEAAEERDAAEERRAELDERLTGLRSMTDALAKELAELGNAAHRDELARAELGLRLEALEDRAVEELGISAQQLVDEFGPHLPVPIPEAEAAGGDKWAALRVEVNEAGQPVGGAPYVRAEQEKRLKKAERDLAALGKVNPLALEEFAALEERHRFLNEQLEDLKASRRDLLAIIKDVDDRVQRVFAEAFADTAVQFERVFGRLFPGGEGRLVLTEPEDMLTTGIEVEARPAGKKIKRLSLLSGGERSLTAVALLVAIFKARPSPFYVMDEVEAALDDTNLGRLITIFEELRESSQLIVITHQKRTMEVADALYGVSMRGDGVSTVISQKLERAESLS